MRQPTTARAVAPHAADLGEQGRVQGRARGEVGDVDGGLAGREDWGGGQVVTEWGGPDRRRAGVGALAMIAVAAAAVGVYASVITRHRLGAGD